MKRLIGCLVVTVLLCPACGPGETELISDTGSGVEVVPEVEAEETVILPEVRRPEDVRMEPEINVTPVDAVPEMPRRQCAPGEGCFLDKCTENAQCQSGWCVEHMGEGVCSEVCTEECSAGWACKQVGVADPDLTYVCVSEHSNLCKPCGSTEGCEAPGSAKDVCVDYGAEGSFCGGVCETADDCPWGFLCEDVTTVDGIETRQCVAEAGACPCTTNSIALNLWTPCKSANEFGTCEGMRICTEEGLSDCDAVAPAEESCTGFDDDCDGDVDEPVVDEGDYINLCDDGNSCTDDNCKGEGGCEYVELNEGECMDGDPCTVADHCNAGVCVGNPVVCDDTNPCTDDSCDGAGGCMFANNTAGCDDEDPCTVADKCNAGTCAGEAIPCDCMIDEDCALHEDENSCNGTLFCDDGQWPFKCEVDPDTVVHCPPPLVGPDAICLQTHCDTATGDCSLVPDHEGFACEDEDACTVGDKCVEGVCTAGVAPICADNNPCTDDSCDPVEGCLFYTNTMSCNDGDVCTTADQCAGGECLGGDLLVCDDANVCNGLETCDSDTGCKAGTPLQCDNGDPCDGVETCHPTEGCLPGLDAACHDGNVCTDDTCDAEGGCLHTPNSAGCDDGNACTEGDHCNGGACVYTGLKECGDNNICTDEWCDPAAGCVTTLNEAPCDDGDICTTGDHCHLGDCISAGELTCDDHNECTDDLCLPAAGCQFTANSAQCDDGSACTTGDQCSDGWCLPSEVLDCDDSNLCTDDSCDGESGCVYAPNSALCDDDDECTENDQCAAAQCILGDSVDCDDGNQCTEDTCIPVTGCESHSVVDGTGCGLLPGERCVNGSCVCVQLCDGKECGPDGCGGSCGNCMGPQELCVGGTCQCQPNCVGKECGDDGCGGECGPCQPGLVCQQNACIESSCGDGEAFGNGCLWKVAGGDLFLVPSGVNSITVIMIGGGGGGGSGYYYPGGGGGSGYYKIEEAVPVTPGQTLLVQVGSGGGMEEAGTASKFGSLTVQGGLPGKPHTAPSGQSSAKGGNGGSGGGAGYTNSSNGGGTGSGVLMGQYAGAPGTPSPGSNQAAKRGQGFGAGGGGDPGTSGYNSSCGGLGGSNGGNGATVGGCGGGGGGAGGLKIPGYDNPGSTGTTAGASGVVFITM